ncbi:hypothetical protein AURDEDRAFT_187386 [Auricularia subglabra TFB-10046 SS5]|nr:hypothetical protein AURDEDRAFT_187386 [Auricularia subglabra TFB-10046 SS5]
MSLASSAAGNIGPTMGAFLVGVMVSILCSLLGITTLQTWDYFSTYPDDSCWIKTLVATVYCAELVHSVLLAHSIYHYVINGFGDYLGLEREVWSLQGAVLFTGAIAFGVQTYLCARVLYMTRNKYLALGCWILAIFRFAFSISLAAHLISSGRLEAASQSSFRWQLIASLSLGAASDVAVACCICAGLLRCFGTAFKKTDKLIEKVAALTIGSGLLTSLLALLELITYIALDNYVWVAVFSILSKVFGNSLLVSLNQRDTLRTKFSRAEPSLASIQVDVIPSSPYVQDAIMSEEMGSGNHVNYWLA